ncbi:unnamed protein product [Protopolystoma xenopodis]|uniref:Uncharacterized protein n=1 Tax=Protopolystoma xenopodis TaxID=117903 RepID=A0A448X5Z3_9PLAT|nr:unnamed protein product [Protopolystoma xenopodis]
MGIVRDFAVKRTFGAQCLFPLEALICRQARHVLKPGADQINRWLIPAWRGFEAAARLTRVWMRLV